MLKDARRAGPLSFHVRPGQLKGVVISEKDEAKVGNAAFRANAYDFEIGYNQRTATIWQPFMCNEVSRMSHRPTCHVAHPTSRHLHCDVAGES